MMRKDVTTKDHGALRSLEEGRRQEEKKKDQNGMPRGDKVVEKVEKVSSSWKGRVKMVLGDVARARGAGWEGLLPLLLQDQVGLQTGQQM
jgi:hypothetical protein